MDELERVVDEMEEQIKKFRFLMTLIEKQEYNPENTEDGYMYCPHCHAFNKVEGETYDSCVHCRRILKPLDHCSSMFKDNATLGVEDFLNCIHRDALGLTLGQLRDFYKDIKEKNQK